MYEHHTNWAEAQNTSWYRSKEIIPGFYPHYGYLGNKKWPLLKVNCKFNHKVFKNISVLSFAIFLDHVNSSFINASGNNAMQKVDGHTFSRLV